MSFWAGNCPSNLATLPVSWMRGSVTPPDLTALSEPDAALVSSSSTTTEPVIKSRKDQNTLRIIISDNQDNQDNQIMSPFFSHRIINNGSFKNPRWRGK